VVIFSFNKEDETIEFRHYLITVVPHGASKSVKKLLGKHLPNLGHYEDISDYIQKYEAAACTRCLLEDGDSRAHACFALTHTHTHTVAKESPRAMPRTWPTTPRSFCPMRTAAEPTPSTNNRPCA